MSLPHRQRHAEGSCPSCQRLTPFGRIGRDPAQVRAGQDSFAPFSVATGGGADDEVALPGGISAQAIEDGAKYLQ